MRCVDNPASHRLPTTQIDDPCAVALHDKDVPGCGRPVSARRSRETAVSKDPGNKVQLEGVSLELIR